VFSAGKFLKILPLYLIFKLPGKIFMCSANHLAPYLI